MTWHREPSGRRGQLATLAFGICLALAATPARAELLIGNLDQPNDGFTSGHQVGAAILMDGAAAPLQSITINESIFGPTSDESMGVYSRNADGTVGSLLFSDFSHDGTPGVPGLTTFTALTAFTLQAGTGYWFLLTDNTNSEVAVWDYTTSTSYTANLGVTMPATKTSYANDGAGTETYFDLASGPQLFQINIIPEPATYASALIGCGVAGFGVWRRTRRRAV